MKMSILLQIVASVALALLLFFGVQTIIESRVVEGSSMEVGLHDGQRLIVVKAAYWFGGPQRGDVVIFKYPEPDDPEKALVKRIIGLPNEQVKIERGIVYINGSPLEEPYINGQTGTYCSGSYCDLTIPAGKYFVMGDNRGASRDSRVIGTINGSDIIGRAWLLYWPLEDWHLIDDYSYVN